MEQIKMISGNNSSMMAIYDILTKNNDHFKSSTRIISKDYQETFDRMVNHVVEKLVIIFKRMIINKTAFLDNIEKQTITINHHESDSNKEIQFYLTTFKSNEMILPTYANYRQIINSDEFYNAFQTKLNTVFNETSKYIQNTLYSSQYKIKRVPAANLFNVYPKITFIHDTIIINVIISLI